jgi:hypothetical protein
MPATNGQPTAAHTDWLVSCSMVQASGPQATAAPPAAAAAAAAGGTKAHLGLWCAHEVGFAVPEVTDLEQGQGQALDHLHNTQSGTVCQQDA